MNKLITELPNFLINVNDWFESKGDRPGKHLQYWPNKIEYPEMNKFLHMAGNIRERYQTFEIKNLFQKLLKDFELLYYTPFVSLSFDELLETLDKLESLDIEFEDSSPEFYIMDGILNGNLIQILKALKEAINTNLLSFEYDW